MGNLDLSSDTQTSYPISLISTFSAGAGANHGAGLDTPEAQAN